jgi:hypothetical protein
MTDAIFNIKVCLKIPIVKRVGIIILVTYIIFYNYKNVIY